jgi:carbonic anhydrase
VDELELRERNAEFIKAIKENDPCFFDKLKEGQTPEFFVLSCSDSRVSPSIITKMPLGHMFIHRNIANQVIANDESFSASLYYSLKHLKVKKIIIQGHTECGGIKAAWENNNEPELKGWLDCVREGLPHIESPAISMEELSKLNVQSQVERVLQHPVYLKYGEDVAVIGSLFHVESGELEPVTPVLRNI